MGLLRRLFGRGRTADDAAARQEIGRVEDYYGKIGVIAIKLTKPLEVGDRIQVRGHTTDFSQPVKSMHIEHESVDSARRGSAVGIRVKKRCRRGDRVFKFASELAKKQASR